MYKGKNGSTEPPTYPNHHGEPPDFGVHTAGVHGLDRVEVAEQNGNEQVEDDVRAHEVENDEVNRSHGPAEVHRGEDLQGRWVGGGGGGGFMGERAMKSNDRTPEKDTRARERQRQQRGTRDSTDTKTG